MTKSKGLGDDIAKFTKATGIDKLAKKVLGEDCGCEERRQKLNQMFPRFKNIRQFTEDEINKLKELQTSYSEKQVQLGQLHVQKLLAEQQLDAIQQQTLDVEKQYVVVQEQEREFVKVLNEKYGPGQLDPETGVFTPTK